MQTVPVSWMSKERTLLPSPVHLHGVPDRRGAALKRCQRCDIPLGSHRCPNPACGEVHGERAGTLCVWCRDTLQDGMERHEVAG
jgi:hypothetical protein